MRKGSVNPLAATLPQFLFLKGGECFFFFNDTRAGTTGSKKMEKMKKTSNRL
jgi:hypothetical protein